MVPLPGAVSVTKAMANVNTQTLHLGQRQRIFLTVAAGVFLSTLDSSQVNVALPSLMRAFHSSLPLTQWVVQGYLLVVTVLLVFCGRLCGRWGCGRVYGRGLLVFAAGSLACAAAPTIWVLIGSRFLQAIGAAMMMAAGPALVRAIFPTERLGRGLGLIGIATSLGLMIGPVVCGLLLRWLHWRAIFLVTVPVAMALALLNFGTFGTNRSDAPGAEGGPAPRFDLAGALLWAAAVTLTVLLATRASLLAGNGGVAGQVQFWLGAGAMVGCWLLFFRHERMAARPILPLALFRQRFFLAGLASSALSFAVLYLVTILVPFYLDRVLHLPPDRIGLVMTALPLTVFVVSPAAGHLHDRIGARIVATCGLLCSLVGMLLLGGLTADTQPLFVAGCLALMGFGQATFLAPNSAAVLAGVSDEQAGMTAGLLATARNFGMLAGTALAGLSFALHFAVATGGLDLRDLAPATVSAFMAALHSALHVGALLALAAVIISWLRGGATAQGGPGNRGEGKGAQS